MANGPKLNTRFIPLGAAAYNAPAATEPTLMPKRRTAPGGSRSGRHLVLERWSGPRDPKPTTTGPPDSAIESVGRQSVFGSEPMAP
jgi:hypothetical protein